jgi:hypothetical protein
LVSHLFQATYFASKNASSFLFFAVLKNPFFQKSLHRFQTQILLQSANSLPFHRFFNLRHLLSFFRRRALFQVEGLLSFPAASKEQTACLCIIFQTNNFLG